MPLRLLLPNKTCRHPILPRLASLSPCLKQFLPNQHTINRFPAPNPIHPQIPQNPHIISFSSNTEPGERRRSTGTTAMLMLQSTRCVCPAKHEPQRRSAA